MGAEAAIHTARQWCQRSAGKSDMVFLSLDFENAFNSSIVWVCCGRSGSGFLAWLLGLNGLWWPVAPPLPRWSLHFRSRCSARRSFGPLFFALALQPASAPLAFAPQAALSSCLPTWMIFVSLGPGTKLLPPSNVSARQVGLRLNPHKCILTTCAGSWAFCGLGRLSFRLPAQHLWSILHPWCTHRPCLLLRVIHFHQACRDSQAAPPPDRRAAWPSNWLVAPPGLCFLVQVQLFHSGHPARLHHPSLGQLRQWDPPLPRVHVHWPLVTRRLAASLLVYFFLWSWSPPLCPTRQGPLPHAPPLQCSGPPLPVQPQRRFPVSHPGCALRWPFAYAFAAHLRQQQLSQTLDKATVEHLARPAPGREAFRAHLKLLQQPGAGACCTPHYLKLLAPCRFFSVHCHGPDAAPASCRWPRHALPTMRRCIGQTRRPEGTVRSGTIVSVPSWLPELMLQVLITKSKKLASSHLGPMMVWPRRRCSPGWWWPSPCRRLGRQLGLHGAQLLIWLSRPVFDKAALLLLPQQVNTLLPIMKPKNVLSSTPTRSVKQRAFNSPLVTEAIGGAGANGRSHLEVVGRGDCCSHWRTSSLETSRLYQALGITLHREHARAVLRRRATIPDTRALLDEA